MDIRTLQTALARIAEERTADPLQAPKNIALALAADAGILLSLFRGLAEHQNLQDDLSREAAADALTSIVVSVAQLANHIGMDASAALRARIKGRPAPALAPLPAQPAGAPEASAAPAPAPAAAVAAVAAVAVVAPSSSAPPATAQKPVPAPAPAPESTARTSKTGERKRGTPEVIAIKVAAPPPTPFLAHGRGVEVVVLDDEPEETAAAAPEAPPPAEEQLAAPAGPLPEPDEHLDLEQTLDLAKAFAAQLDRSTRDDPVLRDLRDELETLRRSLYASNAKKAWIAGSLRTLRGHLEDAQSHSFAEEVRATDFIGRIDRLLAA